MSCWNTVTDVFVKFRLLKTSDLDWWDGIDKSGRKVIWSDILCQTCIVWVILDYIQANYFCHSVTHEHMKLETWLILGHLRTYCMWEESRAPPGGCHHIPGVHEKKMTLCKIKGGLWGEQLEREGAVLPSEKVIGFRFPSRVKEDIEEDGDHHQEAGHGHCSYNHPSKGGICEKKRIHVYQFQLFWTSGLDICCTGSHEIRKAK